MNILLVPIQLDALFVAAETMTTEAFANFSRLPYSKDRKDYNPDTANISESILSTPFQNQNLKLPKGIHLHWTLPAALTKGGAGGTPDSYPAVPNRWLVTRKINNIISQQWVIESDYLTADPTTYNGIAFPDFNPSDGSQPFNYLGRQLPFNAWQEDTTAKRLVPITAMGYGEPSFAAFYPNCYSVFGCYDSEITTEELKNVSYQVVGWYSDPKQDPYQSLKESAEFKQYTGNADALHNFFTKKLNWRIPLTHNDTSQLPVATYCFAQLDMEPEKEYHNLQRQQTVSAGIGNTGTEALAAWLANAITREDGDRSRTEEQLESLLGYRTVSSKELDHDTRYKETRHEKSFKAEKGGDIWEIKPSQQQPGDHTAANDKQEVLINLPSGIAPLLSSLNKQQRVSDELAARLRYRKHLLFADWYKYMLCAYPPDDNRTAYPDIDVVKNYIEKTLLIEPPKVIHPAVLPELHERIRQFNNSNVAALLSVKLHKKDNTAIPAGLVIDTPAWTENLPFSEYCLRFNNDDRVLHGVSIALSNSQRVKAISVWVNIATQQGADATLLATKKHGVQIGKATIGHSLHKVAINNDILSVAQPLQWHQFPKDQWFHLHVEWETPLEKDDIIYLFANNNTGFLQAKLASLRLFERTMSIDELQCDMNILGHHHYTLKAAAGPRYWQPAEPVIVLEGEAVQPTTRHSRQNEDNSLDCLVADVASYPLQSTDWTTLLAAISHNKPAPGKEKAGFQTWTTQPWNPFLLEWQVEVHPVEEGGNLNTDNRDFDPEFITSNYQLPVNNPDLNLKAGKRTTAAAALYTGRSILTPHAKNRFQHGISDYFIYLKQEACYQVTFSPTSPEKLQYNEQLTKWFSLKPAAPKDGPYISYHTWYLDKPVYNSQAQGIQPFGKVFTEENARLLDFNYTLIQAALQLTTGHFLSQALSGFNNALLMHHQTLQLPVADPLGFSGYKDFTNRVKGAIAGNNNLAPLPHNDFLPIRTGAMTIHRLRIIDSFGQGKDIAVNKLTHAASLSNEAYPDLTWLPPRFVAASRINFRWLSALSDKEAMSTLPQDNPICGWLLANYLDNSLMIYDREGHALGLIDQQATWRSTPGSPIHYQIDDITNPHLRKVVQQLSLSGQTFLQCFITAMETALENIHPEADAYHQETALLMSKPVAVTRAAIGLQLKEGPPVHHGWNAFLQDLERDTRNTNNFEKVKLSVRLGSNGKLNDGLIGYWIEDEQTFYSTGNSEQGTQHDQLKYTDQQGNPDLQLTFENAAEKTLTMLIYPPGEVHAFTGMLPVKAIHLPKEQYTPALKNIHVTFLSAPILTGKDQLSLPLPKEMGYEWSWLAQERFTWTEVAEIGIVRKDSAIHTFTDGIGVWQHLLQKGWIIETDDNRAVIVSADQRSHAALDAPFSQQTDSIQHWLNAGHIIPADTKASFADKQTIKEGWLKLKPSS